jgi:NAD(P)H-nitrite reductase large subunit
MANAAPAALIASGPPHCAVRRANSDPVVCQCLGITKSCILAQIRANRYCTLQDIIHDTDAGNGCMSCRPAITEILFQNRKVV